MKPENENLIRDLLEDDSRRENILHAGTRILRRRRQWRAVRGGATVLGIILAVTVLWLRRETSRALPAQLANAAPKSSTVSQVQALTDDELLALFPNTPVGLASLPDGKKRLIFPRPGDEAKFITRL
ncbi:MAG TPA: hypothetical protein VGI88_01670 [Verrucomicrobiae bacterium]|jgi:hypothetical protein